MYILYCNKYTRQHQKKNQDYMITLQITIMVTFFFSMFTNNCIRVHDNVVMELHLEWNLLSTCIHDCMTLLTEIYICVYKNCYL